MARKRLGPERQPWKGIDANERAFGTVRNALVGIILDGVAGVSPELPGHGHRMVSPEEADRYIERGQRVLADFESQACAPGGAQGRAQKWMDRTIDELRRFVTDAEAVRSGKKPQKQTPESYNELRKSLGVSATCGVGEDRTLAASDVNFQNGERIRIRVIGPKGQLADPPFWFTVTGTMSVEDVALQFTQTLQPGMFVSISDDKNSWTFQKETHGGQNAVRRTHKLPTARYREASEAGGHRVADFNTLDDLIQHARDELGATHTSGTDAQTRLYFPRGGTHPYEEAAVWRKSGYWHAQGPGARTGVAGLPAGAKPIGGRQADRRVAESGRSRLTPRQIQDFKNGFAEGYREGRHGETRLDGHPASREAAEGIRLGLLAGARYHQGDNSAKTIDDATAAWIEEQDHPGVREAPRSPRGGTAPRTGSPDPMKIATALSRKVGGSTPEIGKSFGVERGIVFTTLSPEHQQPVVVLVNADDGNIALNIYANENLSDSYESINTFLYGPDGYTSKRVAVEDMAETIKEIWKMVDGYAESWQEEGGGFEIDEAPRRSSHHSPDAFQGRPDPGVPASDLSHLHNPSRAGNVIVSNIEDFNRLLIERLEQLGRTDAPALARKYKKLASAYFGASRTPASTAEEILDMEQRRRAPSKRQRAKR